MGEPPRSDMPGYRQWFEAVDDDGDVAAVADSMAVPGVPQIMEREIVVNQREVAAASGAAAIAQYVRWLGGAK